MIDFLYVFKFEDEEIEKAVKRLRCSIESVIKQDVKIIVSNNSNICIYDKIKGIGNIEYHHFPFDEYFNKSRCINYAVRNFIKTDYFFFSDIDLVYPKDYIKRMLSKRMLKRLTRVVPFTYGINSENYSSDFNMLSKMSHTSGGYAHGNGLIPLKLFLDVWGFDERYKGYGHEDDDFNWRIRAIGAKISFSNEIPSFHLWHPRPNADYFAENKKIFNDMRKQVRFDIRHKKRILEKTYRPNSIKSAFHWGMSPSMDAWIADKGEHFRYDSNLNGESIVFDIGGYKGEWAEKIYKRYNCNLYIFEPIQEFYSEIINRFENNSKIKCYNFGFSDVTIESRLYWHDIDSSKYKKSDKFLNVQLKNFKEFIDKERIGKIDFLKLNVEGEEYNILNQLLDSGLISNIKNILIQFHTFYPNAAELRRNIRKKLGITHDCTFNYDFVWEGWKIK